MRTLLFPLLLAGVAMPALAAGPGDEEDRRSQAIERVREMRAERAEERAEQAEERSEQRVRAPVADRPQEEVAERQSRRIERIERSAEAPSERAPAEVSQRQYDEGSRPERVRRQRGVRIVEPQGPDTQVQAGARDRPVLPQQGQGGQVGQVDSVAGWRQGQPRQIGNVPVSSDPGVIGPNTRSGPIRIVDGSRRLAREEEARRWRSEWRRDRDYDWRRHRDRNRSLFRVGFYYDPFGYHYRRFGIGASLWPGYYSRNYWLNDPWQYRLPYVSGPYRWVRYWDDALLVDLRTGRVVDAIPRFFW